MSAVNLILRPLSSPDDWQQIVHIREEVFIVEQACPPEEEWDAYDATSTHLIGLVDGEPAATSRWRVVEHDGVPIAKLERFAVRAPYRGRGVGRRLVSYTIEEARRAGFETQYIHAQAHLEGFYRSLGFRRTDDPPFEEAGIPHVAMIRHS